MRPYVLPLTLLQSILGFSALADSVKVATTIVEDRKAVIATVEPVHQLIARARIGGTIISLSTREGDVVTGGIVLATVADQKLLLQMQAIDQRIRSQQAQRDQTKIDLDRVQELVRRGVSTQMQLDQARTAFDVAERNLAAMQADRSVIAQQSAEGAVLAPGNGRVLSVAVSEGRVVLPGEAIATLAEDNYILRLSLPERHAQFMRAGDKVLIGARGATDDKGDVKQTGTVRLVYPEIQGGRVIADVDLVGLGNYFVGERTRVFVTTGQRSAMLLPTNAIYQRAGISFVRLQDGSEVVVQPGRELRPYATEILSGLRAGDMVSVP